MICGKCGKPIGDRANNCPYCGARVPEQKGSPPKKAPPRRRKALIICIAAAAALLLTAAGLFLFYTQYTHTDAYQTRQAEKLLLDGKYEEARQRIDGIDNSRADALRWYADLTEQRADFASLYDANKLYASKEESERIAKRYETLGKTINDFSDDDELPPSLQERLKTYRDRLQAFSRCFANWETGDLSAAQTCIADFVSRKHGLRFTIPDLQKSINASNYALDRILANLVETEAYGDFCQHSRSCAVQALDDLRHSIQDQLMQDRADLAEYEKTFSKTKILYFDTVDKTYKAHVSDLLPELSSIQDADDNAAKVYTSLLYAWMAYVLDIR